MTTERIMQVLKLAVGIGSDWAEVDADEIEGEVPKEAPAVTPTRALEVIRDYGLPLAGLDRTALDALPPAAQECAALLCIEARRERWAVVALDLAVDTSSPAGEAMANVMGTFAQFERRMIGQRTKDALAVKRAQGIRLGRPIVTSAEVSARIAQLRATGLSLAGIATTLNHMQICQIELV